MTRTTTTPAVSATRRGTLAALTAAASFGTSGSFGSALLQTGWTPGAAVLFRIAVAALILTVPALVQLGGRWRLLRADAAAVLGFGVFAVAGCQLFYFNAVVHLSVAVALLLEYSGTLLVVVWLWARHGMRPGRLTAAGCALALVGLMLVLDLTGAQRVSVVGIVWGLAAATGLAVYFVVSARAHSGLPPLVLAWAGLVVGSLTLGIAAVGGVVPLRASSAAVHLAGVQLSWLVPALGLALIAAAFAYWSGVLAARSLGARMASFLGLAEVLFAVLFAWLLLGQRPAPIQLLGAALVVGGILAVRAGERDPAAGGVLADTPVPDAADMTPPT